MGFEICCVVHNRLLLTMIGGQTNQHLGEDALFVTALKPVAFATHPHRFQRLLSLF